MPFYSLEAEACGGGKESTVQRKRKVRFRPDIVSASDSVRARTEGKGKAGERKAERGRVILGGEADSAGARASTRTADAAPALARPGEAGRQREEGEGD